METPTPWATEWTQLPWVLPCGTEEQYVELATRLDATLPAQIPDAGAIPSPSRSLSRPRTSAHLDPVEVGAILPGSTLTCPCPLSTASPDRRLELSPLSTKSECLPTSWHVCIQPYYLQIVRCHRHFSNISYKKMPEECHYCIRNNVVQDEEPWTSLPLSIYLDAGPGMLSQNVLKSGMSAFAIRCVHIEYMFFYSSCCHVVLLDTFNLIMVFPPFIVL